MRAFTYLLVLFFIFAVAVSPLAARGDDSDSESSVGDFLPVAAVDSEELDLDLQSSLSELDRAQDAAIESKVAALREKMDAEREEQHKQFMADIDAKRKQVVEEAKQRRRNKHKQHRHRRDDAAMKPTFEETEYASYLAERNQDQQLQSQTQTLPSSSVASIQVEMERQFPEGVPTSEEANMIEAANQQTDDPIDAQQELQRMQKEAQNSVKFQQQEQQLAQQQQQKQQMDSIYQQQQQDAYFPDFEAKPAAAVAPSVAPVESDEPAAAVAVDGQWTDSSSSEFEKFMPVELDSAPRAMHINSAALESNEFDIMNVMAATGSVATWTQQITGVCTWNTTKVSFTISNNTCCPTELVGSGKCDGATQPITWVCSTGVASDCTEAKPTTTTASCTVTSTCPNPSPVWQTSGQTECTNTTDQRTCWKSGETSTGVILSPTVYTCSEPVNYPSGVNVPESACSSVTKPTQISTACTLPTCTTPVWVITGQGNCTANGRSCCPTGFTVAQCTGTAPDVYGCDYSPVSFCTGTKPSTTSSCQVVATCPSDWRWVLLGNSDCQTETGTTCQPPTNVPTGTRPVYQCQDFGNNNVVGDTTNCGPVPSNAFNVTGCALSKCTLTYSWTKTNRTSCAYKGSLTCCMPDAIPATCPAATYQLYQCVDQFGNTYANSLCSSLATPSTEEVDCTGSASLAKCTERYELKASGSFQSCWNAPSTPFGGCCSQSTAVSCAGTQAVIPACYNTINSSAPILVDSSKCASLTWSPTNVTCTLPFCTPQYTWTVDTDATTSATCSLATGNKALNPLYAPNNATQCCNDNTQCTGSKQVQYQCRNQFNEIVSSSLCSMSLRPNATQSCTNFPLACPTNVFSWVATANTDNTKCLISGQALQCCKSSGSSCDGFLPLIVQCQDLQYSPAVADISGAQCAYAAKPNLASTTTCSLNQCAGTYSWQFSGDYGSCASADTKSSCCFTYDSTCKAKSWLAQPVYVCVDENGLTAENSKCSGTPSSTVAAKSCLPNTCTSDFAYLNFGQDSEFGACTDPATGFQCCDTKVCSPLRQPTYSCADRNNNNTVVINGYCQAVSAPTVTVSTRSCTLGKCASRYRWVESSAAALDSCRAISGQTKLSVNSSCCVVDPLNPSESNTVCAGLAYYGLTCLDQFDIQWSNSYCASATAPSDASRTSVSCSFSSCPYVLKRVWDGVTASDKCVAPSSPKLNCSNYDIEAYRAPTYYCLETLTNTRLSMSYPGCSSATLPSPVPNGIACTLPRCSPEVTYQWKWSSWSTCDATCNQTSTLRCVSSEGVVQNNTALCGSYSGPMTQRQLCNSGECSPRWVGGDCTSSCMQSWVCRNSFGVELIDTSSISWCGAQKAPSACYTGSACNLRWSLQTSLSTCPKACVRTINYECVYSTGFPYTKDDSVCTANIGSKPTGVNQPCTDGLCLSWRTGAYSCGTNCLGQRWVRCQDASIPPNTYDESECLALGLAKPSEIKDGYCADGEGYCVLPKWKSTTFGVCTSQCQQLYNVTCSGSEGVVSASRCTGTQPDSVSSCYATGNCPANWVVISTTGADADGYAPCNLACQRTRSFECRWANGQLAQPANCTQTMPATVSSQTCAAGEGQCPAAITYSWEYSSFGACSATCGSGTQTRTAKCKASSGEFASDAKCTSTQLPLSQACNTQECPDPCLDLASDCYSCITKTTSANVACNWCGNSTAGSCLTSTSTKCATNDFSSTQGQCAALPPAAYYSGSWKEVCGQYKNCSACGAAASQAQPCSWCDNDASSSCVSTYASTAQSCPRLVGFGITQYLGGAGCPSTTSVTVDQCTLITTGCDACTTAGCQYCSETNTCAKNQPSCSFKSTAAECKIVDVDMCVLQSSCGNCTALASSENCGWCPSTGKCLKGLQADACSTTSYRAGEGSKCSGPVVVEKYEWTSADWGSCGSDCKQARSVQCVLAGTVIPADSEQKCNVTLKPISTQSCYGTDSTSACQTMAPAAQPAAQPYNCAPESTCSNCLVAGESDGTNCEWLVVNGFGTCVSQAEAKLSTATRYVHGAVASCPATTIAAPVYDWVYSAWGKCDATCTKTRTAQCYSDAGVLSGSTSNCAKTAVLTSTDCADGQDLCVLPDPCQDSTTCSSCTTNGLSCSWCSGTGSCYKSTGALASKCATNNGTLIASSSSCPVATPAIVYTYSYTPSSWTSCQTSCTRSRTLQCANQFGISVDNSFCENAGVTKPVTAEACYTDSCPGDPCNKFTEDGCSACTGQWVGLSLCSWCGGTACVATDLAATSCPSTKTLFTDVKTCPLGSESSRQRVPTWIAEPLWGKEDRYCFRYRSVTCQDEFGDIFPDSSCTNTKPSTWDFVRYGSGGSLCVPLVDCSLENKCWPLECDNYQTLGNCTLDKTYYTTNNINYDSIKADMVVQAGQVDLIIKATFSAPHQEHIMSRQMHVEDVAQYAYQAGQWGSCSSDCGSGRQTRSVICVDTTNNNAQVDVTNCRSLPITPLVRVCNTQQCNIYVTPSGSDSNSGTQVGSGLGSITKALTLMRSSSVADNVITIESGLYDLSQQSLSSPDLGPVRIVTPSNTSTVVFDGTANYASLQGAVLYNLTNVVNPLVIENVEFRNYPGTLFFVDGPKSQVILRNVKITNCTSQTAPAIVARNGGTVTIYNSEFNNNINTAQGSNADNSGKGGVIYAHKGFVYLYGVRIANSRANQGGAIYADVGSVIVMDRSVVTNNMAIQGGAVYIGGNGVDNESADLLLRQSLVEYNYVDTAANVWAATSNPAVGTKASVITSIAPSTLSPAGAAFYLSSGSFLHEQGSSSIIRRNHALNGDGGFAYMASKSRMLIENGQWSDNTALKGKGGFIYANNANMQLSKANVNESYALQGGAFYLVNSISTVTGSKISQCGATATTEETFGGAIFMNGGQLLYVDSEISDNTANNGAALFVANCASTDIWGTTFRNNKAAKYGGAMLVQNCPTTINRNSAFTNNRAGVAGGAMYVQADGTSTSTFTVNNGVSFTQNSALVGNGGALYLSQLSTVSVSNNIRFIGNTAASGGAIYAAKLGKLSLSCDVDATTQQCKADAAGLSGLGNDKTGSAAVVFSGNAALIGGGGAVFINGITGTSQTDLMLRGVRFVENNATAAGGAMVFQAAQPQFITNFFWRNQAGTYGGAIFTDGMVPNAYVTAYNSVFASNNANLDGGAACLKFTVVNATGNLFDDNAALRGGAVYFEENSVSWLVSNTLSTNMAGTGGAVFAINSALQSTGNTFDKQNYALTGGALAAENTVIQSSKDVYNGNTAVEAAAMSLTNSAKLTMTEGQVKNNNASTNAGAFKFVDSTVTLSTNTVVFNNLAQLMGGAIYATGSTVTISGATLDSNKAISSAGAVALYLSSTLSFESGASCKRNTVGNHGGCVVVRDTSSVKFTGSVCSNNAAGGFGGCVAAYDSGVVSVISSSSVSQNQGGDGGALYFETGASLTATDSNIVSNFAQGNGGAMFLVDSSTASVSNVRMANNTATKNGGFVHTTSFGAVTIVAGYAAGNIAQLNDGGFASAASGGILSISNLVVEANSALNGRGGAISSPNPSTLTLLNTDLKANQASQGGALSLDWRVATLISSTRFLQNKAVLRGGALFMSGVFPYASCAVLSSSSNFKLSALTFANNQAAQGGGAVYFNSMPTGTLPVSDALLMNVATAPFLSTSAAACVAVRSFVSSVAVITPADSFCSGCIVSSNSALYGSVFASSSRRGVFQTAIPSKIANNQVFSVKVTLWDDFQNQVVGSDADGTQLKLGLAAAVNATTPNTALLFAGSGTILNQIALTTVASTQANNAANTVGFFKTFSFDKVYVSGEIDKSFQLVATSQTGSVTSPVLASIAVPMKVANCGVGEKRVGQLCVPCPAGTYNLNGDGVCYYCPTEAVCPNPTTVLAAQDHWQDPTIPLTELHLYGSDAFYKCDPGFCCPSSAGCSLQKPCDNGRSGLLCGMCPSGWVGNTYGQCFDCPTKYYPIVVGFFSFAPIVMQFVLFTPNPDTLFPIFMTFFQLFPYAAGSDLSDLDVLNLNIIGTANANDACVYALSPLQEIAVRYLQCLAAVAWYLIFVIIVLSYRCVSKKDPSQRSALFNRFDAQVQRVLWFLTRVCPAENHLVVGAIRVYIFCYTAITDTSLLLVNCRKVAGLNVLDAAPDQECWKGDHLPYGIIALILLILYVFAAPFALVWWVYRRSLTAHGKEYCRVLSIETSKWAKLQQIEDRTNELLKGELKAEREAASMAEKFYNDPKNNALAISDPSAYYDLEMKFMKAQSDTLDLAKRKLNFKKMSAIDADLDYYELDEEQRIRQDMQDPDAIPVHYWSELTAPFKADNQLFFFLLFFRRVVIIAISVFVIDKFEMNAAMACMFYLQALLLVLRDPYLDAKSNYLDYMAMIGLGTICAIEVASDSLFIARKYIYGIELCILLAFCCVGVFFTLPAFIPPQIYDWYYFKQYERETVRERELWEEKYAAAKTPEERTQLMAEREKARATITLLARRPLGLGLAKARRFGARRGGGRGGGMRRR